MISKEQYPEPYFWLDRYTVHSYHADVNRSLSIPAIFNFLQESAWHHASSNAFGWEDLMKQDCIWALSQLKLKVERLPMWGERLQLLTWSRGAQGLFAYRDFELYDANDCKLISASSAWLILDAETRKPMRMDTFSEHFPSVPSRASMNEPIVRMHKQESEPCSGFFSIRPSDIDMNGHVNNVSYVRWITDAFSIDYMKQHCLKEAEICFLAESRFGDMAGVSLIETDNNKYRAAVIRESDGRELALMTLSFE